MIFKQETIQSWFSGVGSSINNEVIQPFQNAEQVIWKYNQAIQHNSLTQQGWERLLAQSDDSLKAYLTSIKGTTATMTGYNVSLQGNVTGFKKVSSAITQYNALSASGTKEQNIFANAVSVTNGKLGTYLTGLNGAKASLGGYVISLVGATVKTVALKVATIALNSAITMGASLIISGVVSAISEWIHKTENMISASEDAIEKIKSINDELKNNQKTISDTAKRYAELAQGVDQLTGKNISLSNEDYEEFLTLSNQLAEMFPTLTRNYNDNGDAIVQLSGDVDTIVGSLQNLIEAQRDLANRQIVDELPTVFDGVAAKSDKYEQQLSDLESRRDALVKSLGDMQSEEFSSNFMDGFSNKWIEISGDNLEVISQMRDDYMKILKEANIDFEELTPTYEVKDGIEVPVGFTIKINSSDEDVEKAKNTIDDKIQELASQYETDINKLNEEIITTNEKNKANWTSLSSSIFAWLSTDDSFKVMDDTMQATVQNIVNSLDWGSLDFSSWEDAKQYIQENILSLFNTTEGKETLADIEVMFGIQTQFNNGDITVEQYQQKLQDFLNSIENLPSETKKSILLLFGIQTNEDGTTTSDTDTMINNVKDKLSDEFDGKVGELTLDELEIASKLEIPEGTLLSWDELITKIEEVKNASPNETDILSFSDAWNSEDFEDVRKELLSLAEAGQLTPETLQSTDEYKTLLKQTGLSAEEAAKKINELVSSSTQLQSMSAQISKMSDILADKKNGTVASASDLAGFDATVKGLESWEEFERVMGSSKSSMEECQTVANALATEWVNSNNFLANLDETNKDYYETQLANMGVENAQAVVSNALAQKRKEEALATEYATLALAYNSDAKNNNVQVSDSLSNATANDIVQLIEEGNVSNETAKSLANYYFEKLNASNLTIATAGDCQNLANLCESLGIAASVLRNYAYAKQVLEAAQTWDDSNPLKKITIENQEKALKNLEEQAKNVVKQATDKQNNPVKVGATGSGSSDGSSSEKDTVQTFDWINTAISRIQRRISNLGKVVSSTWKAWSNRNNALTSELTEINKQIALQQQAMDAYAIKANSVELSDYYKNLIKNGNLRIDEIADEDLKNKINDYKKWYEKIIECSDAIEDLRSNLAELAKTKFEEGMKQFDNSLIMNLHESNMIDGFISQAEETGYLVSEAYYNALIENQNEQVDVLTNKYNSLEESFKEAMDTGAIEKYSDDWYDMVSQINDVEKALQDANTELIKYQKTLKELAWTTFDNFTNSVSGITNESDFLIGLTEYYQLFDDYGNLTDMGITNKGLHAQNYNVYMEQSLAYAKEIEEIQKEIENSPNNTELTDRYNELVEKQRESINGAISEKKAIIDLAEEGYDKLINSLEELISTRKEAMDWNDDLRDYEKTVEKQTKTIASYKKQLLAYSGDNSEESKATIQKLQVSLADAEESLQETEHERWKKDQQKMLDDLYNDTQNWINRRLDNSDMIVGEAIASTNQSIETISETIQTLPEAYGAKVSESMSSIWSIDGVAGKAVGAYKDIVYGINTYNAVMSSNISDSKLDLDIIKNKVSMFSLDNIPKDIAEQFVTNGIFSNPISNASSGVQTAIGGISTEINNTKLVFEQFAKDNIASIGKIQAAIGANNSSSPTPVSTVTTSSTTAIEETTKNVDESVDDINKTVKEIADTSKKVQGGGGRHIGLENLATKRFDTYATGSKKIKREELAWTQENGREFIFRKSDGALLTPLNTGDKVFTAEMSDNLWEIANNPMLSSISSPKFTEIKRNPTNISNNIQLNIPLPNVTNYNEFISQLQSDRRFEKIIQDMTIGQALGKNSLNKYKH